MPNELNIKMKFSPEMDVAKINVLLKALKSSLGMMGKDIQLLDANKINAELSKVTQSTIGLDNAMKKASQSGKGVENAITKVGKSAGAMTSGMFSFNQMAMGMQMFSTALSSVLTPFVELDKQVKNIGTLGRANFEEFSQMASDLSVVVPDSAATIAEGVYQAISASMRGTNEELMDFVEIASKAGVAGLSDTKAAVDGLTSVINAYGMETSDAQTVSDTFFAAIKLGKTTFNELNSSLASFVPTAAAVGVSFDQGAAAISSLTSMGTPTAMAGTQINAALISILKGNASMTKGLKGSGLTLKDLQEKLKLPIAQGGGLVNVMRDIKLASEKSGVALIKMMGRAEGMKLVEQLTGTQEKYNKSLQMYADVSSEIAGGASTKAFEVAATSLSAQTAGFMSTMESYFATAFRTMGDGAVGVASKMEKLMPLIMGFGALGPVFGKMGMGVLSLSTSLIQKLIPSLFATAAAQKGVEAGTLGSATAFKVLAKAMLTTPIGLMITAVVGLVAAYAIFHKSSMDVAEDNLKEAKATEDLAKKKVDLNTKQQALAKSNIELGKEYKKLGENSKRTKEEDERFLALHRKLTASYHGVLGDVKDYKNNQIALSKAMGTTNLETEKATVENAKLIARYEELGNKTNKTKEETKEFETIQGQLNDIFPEVIGNTKDWTSELDLLKLKAGLTSGELINLQNSMKKLSAEMQAATTKRLSRDIGVLRAEIGDLLSPGTWGKIQDFTIGGLSAGWFKSLEGGELDKIKAGITKFNTEVANAWSVEALDIQATKLQSMFFGTKKEVESYFGKGTLKLIEDFGVNSSDILNKIIANEIKIIEIRKQKLAVAGKIEPEEKKKVETKTCDKGFHWDEETGMCIEDEKPPPDGLDKSNEKKKTAYELAKIKYDLDKKSIEQTQFNEELDKRVLIASEKRKATTEEEIAIQDEKLKSNEAILKNAKKLQEDIKLGKIVLDKKEVEAGVAQQVDQLVVDLNNEIKKDKIQSIELQTKLSEEREKLIEDIKKLKEEIQAGEITLIKMKIEASTDPAEIKNLTNQIIAIYKSQIEKINYEISKNELDIAILENKKRTDEEEEKYLKLIKLAQDYAIKKAEIEKGITETEKTEQEKQDDIKKAQVERYKSYALQLTDAFGATMDNLIKGREAFGKELLLSMIDIVEKELLVAQIEALGTALGQFFINPLAALKVIGIIAAIKVAGSGLKALAGSETGDSDVGVTAPKKAGSSDKYLRLLAKHERVQRADVNKKYGKLFDYIDEGGDPAEFYKNQNAVVAHDGSLALSILSLASVIKTNFADKDTEGIKELVKLFNDRQKVISSFYADNISVEKFAKIMGIKSFASGSGFIGSPTLSVLGDNTQYPEAALLEPQIAQVGLLGGMAAVGGLKKELTTMTDLQARTVQAIENLNTRFYVLEKDVAEGTNRHNTKEARRIRT